MRLLRINGTTVDIDEKTAIGVDYQSYDMKTPGVRKVNITNTFTVPITDNNLNIFGYPNSPQSISKKVYSQNIVDYWVGNEKLIDQAKIRVNGVDERITLFVFQKPDVWDSLKKVLWADFVEDFVTWMHDNKGLPSLASPFLGTFTEFVTPYTTSTEGVHIPFFFSNLYNYDPRGGDSYLEDPDNLYIKYFSNDGGKTDGAHLCVYCKTIFEYIEDTFNVNFLTGGGQLVGNLWDDVIANSLYIPIRDIELSFHYILGVVAGFYYNFNLDTVFLPLRDQKDKADKTLYDFLNLIVFSCL